MHLLKQTANDAVVNAVEDVISTASGTTFYLLSSVTDAPSSTFLTQNEGEPHPPPLCLPQSATPTTSVYLSQPHPPPLYTSVNHTHHHIYKCTLLQSRPNIHRIKSPSTPHKPDSGGLPKVSCFTNMYVRTHVGVVISTQYEMFWT